MFVSWGFLLLLLRSVVGLGGITREIIAGTNHGVAKPRCYLRILLDAASGCQAEEGDSLIPLRSNMWQLNCNMKVVQLFPKCGARLEIRHRVRGHANRMWSSHQAFFFFVGPQVCVTMVKATDTLHVYYFFTVVTLIQFRDVTAQNHQRC